MTEQKEPKMEDASERRPFFIELQNAPRFTQMEGLETTVLTGLHDERMMMVLNATLPGHSVPAHSHPHEQVGVVYGGRAILCIGGEERVVQRGDFYCIPAGVPHSDIALGDEPFVMLDVFYPVREDFVARCEPEPEKIAQATGKPVSQR